MLDFRIQTFLCVCNHMNFTKAAHELHITQPAVSQHIHYLETLYGTKIFFHEGKKISLTPAGKILCSTATTLRNDEHFMTEQMKHSTTGDAPLIFGVTMTIGEFVIAAPLARYLKQHPTTDLRIELANTSELLNRLKTGKINFALVEGYFNAANYDTLTYRTEDFIPVCAASHAFTGPVHLHDLLKERLIVREPGSGTRDILEKNLAIHDIVIEDFAHTAEVSSMHTIVELLLADCGISFLYKTAVEKEVSQGLLCEIPLKDFSMTHDFTFLWNKGSIFGEHYRHICQELLVP